MHYNEAYLNVQHHISNVVASWAALKQMGGVSQAQFEEGVRRAISTLELFLGERIENFPDQEIIDAHQHVFRIGQDRLKNVRYPESIDEAVRLMESLRDIAGIYKADSEHSNIWAL